MSQISQKSISGITSITTPAGVDNQLTLHTNNTTEAVKLDTAGNLHFHNHLNITGISTASNFKTGTSNLHNTGLNVQDLDVDGHTNLDNVSIAGVTTVSGSIVQTSGHTQLRSFSNATSGAGMELGYDGTRAIIQPYDRDNSVSKNLYIAANVGINQINPTAKLDVVGGFKVSGSIDCNGGIDVDGHTNLDNVSIAGVSTISNHFFLQKDAAYIDFKQTDGTQTGYIQSRTTDFRFNSYGARPVKFGTNDIERVRIDSDGKVGINTDDARFNNASNIASASFYHNDPKFGVHGSMGNW